MARKRRSFTKEVKAPARCGRCRLPDEALIPARSVIDDGAFDRVVNLLERPAAPTAALRELVRGQDR